MRLWSLHPKYLDARGLVALWREALLAQAVLRGETRGYRRHPQLERFRNHAAPLAAMSLYLRAIHAEAAAMQTAAPVVIATPVAAVPPREGAATSPAPLIQPAGRATPNPTQFTAAKAALLPDPSRAAEAAAAGNAAGPISETADGAATYYVPNKMIEKVPSVVHLWIDPVMPVRDLQEKLARQLKLDFERIKLKIHTATPMGAIEAGSVEGLTRVRVGDRMFAQLSGNDFEFSPKDPTPGELDGATWKWHWQVTPQRASKSQPLLLTIKAWIHYCPVK